MTNKTLCVDAQNILKLAFHGNKDTYTEFGYIGAIVTFYTCIRKLIKEYHINKVILFWDSEASGKLRHDIYPYYKANRKHKDWYSEGLVLSEKDINREENADKSLLKQRERIKQYAEELFIRQVEDLICEADDCIAYYINNLKEPDENVIIYSADKDFCQLVGDNVWLYLANKKFLVTEKNYNVLYFDHHPKNSALIKAIEGCDSDNIYGVENIGEKTLLKHFPEMRKQPVTFDHLLERAKEINRGRKKPYVALQNLIEGKTIEPIEGVINGKHLFELNYKLVNLKEPFLTEECKELIETATLSPMSDEDRGGKNLLRLMYEDGFIKTLPGGPEGYKNFLIEFLSIVKKEKYEYQKYLQS